MSQEQVKRSFWTPYAAGGKRLLTAVVVLVLAACNGGGGSGGASQSSFSVQGSTPGTVIEASCDNGAYYRTNSTSNGTSQHPFKLSLPAGLDCVLTMITNENSTTDNVVTPIGFTDSNGHISLQVTAVAGTVVDVGFVDLDMTRSTLGTDDSNADGVHDTPLDLGQPTGLDIKDHSGASPEDQDDDGIPNRYDDDYDNALDTDDDGIPDGSDVNPDNSTTASNEYPAGLDRNHDGYLDDDINHDGLHDDGDDDSDGYYDDDANQDGFHDDDVNHDGYPDSSGLSFSEVRGTITAKDAVLQTLTVQVTTVEKGGVPKGQPATVDVSNTDFGDTSFSALAVNDVVKIDGDWDGTVLHAFEVEKDD